MLSFITFGSERQIALFKQCQSNASMSVSFGGWGGGNMRRRQNLEINERHFARFNFSRLSLAFILNSSLILGNIFF